METRSCNETELVDQIIGTSFYEALLHTRNLSIVRSNFDIY